MRRLALSFGLALSLPFSASAVVFDLASQGVPLEVTGGSARAYGMGAAYIAVADDSSSVLWNPAALGRLKHPDISFHHQSYLVNTSQETITGAMPLGAIGGLGMSVSYFSFGSFESRDGANNLIGDHKASRMNAAVGYGYSWPNRLSLGLTLKGIFQTLADTQASAFSTDLGVDWELKSGIRFALAAINIGTGVGDDPVQSSISFGASYQLSLSEVKKRNLTLSVGSAIEPSGINRYQFGAEFSHNSRYFLRAGYILDGQDNELEGLQGVSVGGGVVIRQASLDYGFVPYGDLGNSHRFSLGWNFSQQKKKKLEASSEKAETVQKPVPVKASAPPKPKPKLSAADKQKYAELLAAVRQKPKSPRAWKTLADFFYEKKSHKNAIKSYERVLQLAPKATNIKTWLDNYKKSIMEKDE